jgi:hypothetical protein
LHVEFIECVYVFVFAVVVYAWDEFEGAIENEAVVLACAEKFVE